MGILILAAFVALIFIALWKVVPFVVRPYLSPLRRLPGPPSPSWFYGHFRDIFKAENSVLHEKWIEEYGNVITYAGFLNINRLYTLDSHAMNHILTHSTDFQKPEQTRSTLTRLLGAGVLVTEGEQHRQQNPAFGPSQIRELTSIFNEKALQLRDIWAAQLPSTGEAKRIDVLSWLSRATLDIIGLAGFSYEFNNLEGSRNELNEAFKIIFNTDQQIRPTAIIQALIPILRFVIRDERMKNMDDAQAVMRRIGMQLVAERKAAVLAGTSSGEKGGVERKDLEGRDLLTLLIKANMATDIPESQRLSDEDVLAQVPTFLIAGHETTSTAVTWCLYALTQAPRVQQKLREELLSVPTETPTMDELMALPYLDMVVRETLRIHAPVPSTVRTAVKEDVIPVGEPYTDRYGNIQNEVHIQKDDVIMIPILAINRSKKIWGEDSFEFRPERWESPPEGAAEIPGVWGHLLTFLGGPRACIGYRFSLVEMKAILFALVRAFEFELAVKPEDLIKKSGIVQRPVIISEKEKGNQMPLLVKAYRHAS
ncbi:unnamed protein product [Somion occarium]|uniref:Cytochrome P450 n=1 Tax=Somion occarium TaxID=3059160 RepID=A0ABP1DQX0_9APHY